MNQENSICTSCNIDNLEVTCGDESFNAKDVLPEGLCFLNFHQIFPYIKTLTSGGWFNWVGHDEHVIVKCPSMKGIATHVKAPTKTEPDVLECEVMEEKSGQCFRGHKMGDKFRFDIRVENLKRLETLHNLFPDLMNVSTEQHYSGEMQNKLGEVTQTVKYSVDFTKAPSEAS